MLNGNINIYLATLLIGLGCGTSCNQLAVLFLGSWIGTSKSSASKGFATVLQFLLGKAIIYIFAAFVSGLFGILIHDVYIKLIGNFTNKVFGVFLLLFGVYYVFKHFNKASCLSCHQDKKAGFLSATPKKAIIAGLAYGITPCPPMAILMINASGVDLLNALLLGVIFATASFLNPLLLVGLISGKISQAMREEISNFVIYFQLALAVFFCVFWFLFNNDLIKRICDLIFLALGKKA